MAITALRKIPPVVVIAVSIMAVFLVDVLSGPEISISIFYLIPISIATWSYSRRSGIALSFLCALLWLVGERIAGTPHSSAIIPVWNMLVRFGFFVIVAQTLSTRRRIERELVSARRRALEAARAKNDFANRVTHELRTPLTAILGFSDVLKRQAGPYLTNNDQECLKRIRANADTLLRLVDGVLQVARVESGKSNVTIRSTDVRELMNNVLADLRARPRADQLDVRLELPTSLQPLETDPDLLQQIILNLGTNAVKFTDDGFVRIGVDSDGNGNAVAIFIEDSGIGIATERVKAVFEPFEQADATIHRRFGGAGLGLSIAKDLCTALGYSLEVDSKPGVGSKFTVRLGAQVEGLEHVSAKV